MATQTVKKKKEINGDAWQSILDEAYARWDNYGNSYGDMVRGFRKDFGDIATLALLMGKFNQQVNNNGLDGYQFNSYAGDNYEGCNYAGQKVSLNLHKLLTQLFNQYFSYNNAITREFAEILESFEPTWESVNECCYTCEGSGVYEEEDEDGEYIKEECPECDGSGESESSDLYLDNHPSVDDLQERYFKISSKVFEYGCKFFAKAKKNMDFPD